MFKKKKARIKCVYAGPEMMEKDMAKFGGVYAGPEMMTMKLVYGGPETPDNQVMPQQMTEYPNNFANEKENKEDNEV